MRQLTNYNFAYTNLNVKSYFNVKIFEIKRSFVPLACCWIDFHLRFTGINKTRLTRVTFTLVLTQRILAWVKRRNLVHYHKSHYHLIMCCLNCIRRDQNATYNPGLILTLASTTEYVGWRNNYAKLHKCGTKQKSKTKKTKLGLVWRCLP